jgi:hypothetical protein
MDGSLKPTDEQQDCIDKFGTGESLAITAGAGAGKTSTLAMMGLAYPHRRLRYIAFSKALATDAKAAMPENVEASTLHSMAFKVTGAPFGARLRANRMKGWQVAKNLGITGIQVDVGGDKPKWLEPGYLAGVVMKGLERFCASADPEPTTRHFPYVEGIDLPDELTGRRTYENNEIVRLHLVPALRNAWADWQDPNGSKTRYGHAGYLKAFQLEGRQIEADALLIDEAQDLQPVSVAIAAQQTKAQLCLVGDPQQAIFEWMGSVNAMEEIGATHRATLATSFRFGPAIAEVANEVLALLGADLRLIGGGPPDSKVEHIEGLPASVLTRTNARAVTEVLSRQKEGHKVHLVGGGSEIAAFAKGAADLQAGRRTTHPELACFDSWNDVKAFVTTEADGDDLRLMVRLVDEFTVPVILAALDEATPENRADVIVSTAHKGKGRTFTSTMLGGDFPDEVTEPPEYRLLYVACTRPRHVLDVTRCGAMTGILGIDKAVDPPIAAQPTGGGFVTPDGPLSLFGEAAS